MLTFFFMALSITNTFSRVISFSPAITKTILDLGGKDKVVGVSQYCQDERLPENITRVGTPFTPRLESVISLGKVTALTQKVNNKFTNQLKSLGVPFQEFSLNSFQDIQETAKEIQQKLDLKMAPLTELEEMAKALKKKKLKGNFLVVIESSILGGNVTSIIGSAPKTYLSDIFEMTGLKNYIKNEKIPYPSISIESLIANKPDFIVFFDKGQGKEIKKAYKATIVGKSKILLFNPKFALIPSTEIRFFLKELILAL